LLVNPGVDFSTPEGHALAGRVTDSLLARKQELGLADVRSLTAPLGATPAAQRGLAAVHAPEEARREAAERSAVEHYTTDLGERMKPGPRFDLVLEHGPFSQESVAALDRVEPVILDALPPELRQNSQLYINGSTASVRDLQVVVRQDRTRIEVLVLAAVFVILVLLLRQLLVSAYL